MRKNLAFIIAIITLVSMLLTGCGEKKAADAPKVLKVACEPISALDTEMVKEIFDHPKEARIEEFLSSIL
ncbi:MAG: entry exclusion lipoprotein TrbK [Phascolarctobacterium sp.]|nr:entry exclusion lipoprotein TrbK [Phascolarctobacterium sp.]